MRNDRKMCNIYKRGEWFYYIANKLVMEGKSSKTINVDITFIKKIRVEMGETLEALPEE